MEAFLEAILTVQSVAIRCKNMHEGIAAYRAEKYTVGKGKGDLHVFLMGASGEQYGA